MKNNKRIVICILLIVIMIGTLLIIGNKPKKTFEFNGSTIALLVNGEVSNTFPSKGLYQIDITCDNANGVWDIDNWKLDIKNITGNVSCNVSFTSNPKLLSNVVNTTSTSGEVSGNGFIYKPDENGVRYKGNNPNNYIWYNKELYRIIGKTPVCTAVNTDGTCSTWNNNGLVKIIRNDSIGGLVYNADTTSSSTWVESTIQKNLNECFLGQINSRNNTTCASYCYSYYNSEKPVAKCDYTQNGIASSGDYYNMIYDGVYWNIGFDGSTSNSGSTQYTKEKASLTSTTLKIGLMYASDYGYAMNSTNDYKNNWLFTKGYEWTMTAYSSSYPVDVYNFGDLSIDNAYHGYAVRPVLYLKSNVYVISGDGSEGNPYKIMLG